MLAGQGHLGGGGIGPIALEEAAERHGKAEHNHLQARDNMERSTPRSTEHTCPPAAPGGSPTGQQTDRERAARFL